MHCQFYDITILRVTFLVLVILLIFTTMPHPENNNLIHIKTPLKPNHNSGVIGKLNKKVRQSIGIAALTTVGLLGAEACQPKPISAEDGKHQIVETWQKEVRKSINGGAQEEDRYFQYHQAIEALINQTDLEKKEDLRAFADALEWYPSGSMFYKDQMRIYQVSNSLPENLLTQIDKKFDTLLKTAFQELDKLVTLPKISKNPVAITQQAEAILNRKKRYVPPKKTRKTKLST